MNSVRCSPSCRDQGVTIFISTHFMNEAARCDRISLMHAGRVLASGTPAELQAARNATTLEDVFIDYPSEAAGLATTNTPASEAGTETETHAEVSAGTNAFRVSNIAPASVQATRTPPRFSLRRLLGYAWREALELRRDPMRLTFALLGSVLLMFMLGYGITLDIENLRFAAFDREQSPESRARRHRNHHHAADHPVLRPHRSGPPTIKR